jgi:endonuclease YncB( thermonuclease family)
MFIYDGVVKDCYDGDTVDIVIEIYPDIHMTLDNARLYGIDTPEKRSSNPKEKKFAKKVTKYVKKTLSYKPVKVQVHGKGKYGRALVTIYLKGVNINDELIKKGYAKEYHGGKKEKWSKS